MEIKGEYAPLCFVALRLVTARLRAYPPRDRTRGEYNFFFGSGGALATQRDLGFVLVVRGLWFLRFLMPTPVGWLPPIGERSYPDFPPEHTAMMACGYLLCMLFDGGRSRFSGDTA